MDVRLATINDLDELFFLNELFENTTTKQLMEKSILENQNEIICIAFIDGVACAYATAIIISSMCYENSRADIETLFVRQEYRNQGIGEALIKCLEDELLSRGIVHFHLTTHSGNNVALSLYKKIGYKNTGELLLDKTVDNR